MADLISRQAAIDALAKFVPYAICDESTESYTNGLTDAYNLICQLPSAQPEIIRCKDCRFWKKYKYFNGKPTYAPFCGFNSIFTDDNDFCSRAEKRGEQDG